ncbi:MAG: NADH-quinone oxidoreductase subunit J [Actinomycetales bacterium]|nr:NADH-quinone oxidoreductase subunit J [Actinomycetales bacterium]
MTFLFWILATLSVIGGLGMLLSRKAVHSALWLALTMMCLAVLYVAQSAVFLGTVQVIVYTGAVMMLFLFVLMLIGVSAADSLRESIRGQRPVAVLVAVALGATLIAAVGNALDFSVGLQAANAEYGGNVQGLAALMFGRYLIAFEATAALLITAALGATILAHRERLFPRQDQRTRSVERFRSGVHPGQRPSPGVYARHNAVDVPALLPDGSAVPDSIPGPLRARGTVREIDATATEEVLDRLVGGAASDTGGER